MPNTWWELMWRLPILVTTGAITAVASFAVTMLLSAWRLRYIERQRRVRRAAYAAANREDEVALVLSIGKTIEPSARDYLNKSGRQGITLYTVHRAEGFDEQQPQVWLQHLEKINNELQRINQGGPTKRIYLFCNLPVAMSVLVGAVLANSSEVVVHHFAGGHYFQIGRLTGKLVTL